MERSAAYSAKMDNEDLVDPVVRKLSLMTKKELFAKFRFCVLLRELS
jgi:hypothetical protein